MKNGSRIGSHARKGRRWNRIHACNLCSIMQIWGDQWYAVEMLTIEIWIFFTFHVICILFHAIGWSELRFWSVWLGWDHKVTSWLMRGTLRNHWQVLALKAVRVGVAQLYQKGHYHLFLLVQSLRTRTRAELAILVWCVCIVTQSHIIRWLVGTLAMLFWVFWAIGTR